MVPARTWGVHAVGMAHGKVQIEEAHGSSCRQKEYNLIRLRCPFFMEAFGLEVEEDLSTQATQYWAEGVWTGHWYCEQKEAWIRQIQEVQMWRQVREPAGAVMCDTRDWEMAVLAHIDLQ